MCRSCDEIASLRSALRTKTDSDFSFNSNFLHSLGGQGAAEANVVVRIRRAVVPIRGPTPVIRSIVPIAAGIEPPRQLKLQ